jgi:hypothetical protein
LGRQNILQFIQCLRTHNRSFHFLD